MAYKTFAGFSFSILMQLLHQNFSFFEVKKKTLFAFISGQFQEYKPACSKDIPIEFNVTLLKNAPNPLGILRSKGEFDAKATLLFD